MKNALKIILWMFLGAFVFVLLVGGAFGFYIYRSVKSNVIDYTCQRYVDDNKTIFTEINQDGDKKSMSNALRPLGVVGSLLGYVTVRENGSLNKATLQNKALMIRYNNELASICEQNPTLKPFMLFGDVKKNNVPPAVKAKVDELLKSVTVTDHPQGSAFVEIIVKGLTDRMNLIDNVSTSLQKFTSSTEVSSSVISPTAVQH